MNNLSITYTLKPLAELDVIEIANGMRNGQFHTLAMRKTIKTRKGHEADEIIKISLISGRFGVDYDNLSETIEERANGKEKGELKGFECLVEDFLYRSLRTGKLHVRFTTYKGGKHEAFYFLNGKPATFEELAGVYANASDLRHTSNDGREARPLAIAADSIVYLQ